MTLKNRLKAALTAFVNPSVIQKPATQKPLPKLEPEPAMVMDNQLLAGKNVLITGAGKNIGRSIALEMAKQGANIFLTDIVEERCKKIEDELKQYNIKNKSFLLDVSNPEESEVLANWFSENKTSVDIFINNVGIQFETIGIKNIDLAEWHQTFNTNVIGPVYLTKLISQKMISDRIQGSIIFMSSVHQTEIIRWPSYSASKAALGMIIQEFAVDLAPYGIRVNGIAPAWVAEDEQGQPLGHDYHLLHHSSINPRYIGRAAVYLASDYFSNFTTGTIIKIDAGVSLYNYRVVQNPPQ